jgi:hypothetical protein
MASYHEKLIIAFVRSDSPRMLVYLKQSEEDKEYAVKILHPIGNVKTIVYQSYSLSSAMKEMAETIGQFTNGFSTWKTI